jgi:HlyD family secretion protein
MSKRLSSRIMLALLSISLLAIFTLAVTGCGGGPGMPPPEKGGLPNPIQAAAASTAIPTSSATATPVPPKTTRATGTLLAPNQAALAFQASGTLKELKVKEGDTVKAGDILAKLDTTTLELQVTQAETALQLQQINLDKVKAGPSIEDIAVARSALDQAKIALDQAQAAYDPIAWRPDVGMTTQAANLQSASSKYKAAKATYDLTIHHPTNSELATAQTQYDQAKASLAIVKQNLTNTTLVAPFDGTILSVTPKAGEIVSQSITVMTLADLTRMQAQASLDENTLARVQVGQQVKLTLDAFPNKTLSGRVSKIALIGTSAGGVVSVPVTIDIDPNDTAIYPGLSTVIEFKTIQ